MVLYVRRTGRFTGSPESAMEFDLAGIRNVSELGEFVRKIRHACDIALTNDFWDVSHSNALATSFLPSQPRPCSHSTPISYSSTAR